uniref:Uncharacterized protein n=1 Tax=Siphoviridae sp. ctEZK6 TaxID=2825397 RepID=A0A8S5UT01_9CAUD|nr:MAG TPA: hypothetical protein [Siphoviridae sp. ctEZK6]
MSVRRVFAFVESFKIGLCFLHRKSVDFVERERITHAPSDNENDRLEDAADGGCFLLDLPERYSGNFFHEPDFSNRETIEVHFFSFQITFMQDRSHAFLEGCESLKLSIFKGFCQEWARLDRSLGPSVMNDGCVFDGTGVKSCPDCCFLLCVAGADRAVKHSAVIRDEFTRTSCDEFTDLMHQAAQVVAIRSGCFQSAKGLR